MTDVLKLDPLKTHRLEFAVDVIGEDSPVTARLAMEADGTTLSFSGAVEDGKVTIVVPKLSGLTKQDHLPSQLEVLVGSGDAHRLFVPSKFSVELERRTQVKAGMPTLLQPESIVEPPVEPEEIPKIKTTPLPKEQKKEKENVLPIITSTETSGPELTLESLGVDLEDIDLEDEPLLPPSKNEIAKKGKRLRQLAQARRRFKR